MPSHVHLIFRDKENQPDKLLGNIKRYSSKQLQEAIQNIPEESRREWLFWMMENAASKTSNVNKRMLWQHHNHPIELSSQPVIQQKLDYVHLNPVKAGFVTAAEDWKYSSAINYAGGSGETEVMLLY